MSKQDLPQESAPLTPFGYWQESFQAWTDFSRQTSQILMSKAGSVGRKAPLDSDDETVASELLRTFSDFNLRHWQNTARFLESMPAWMRVPNTMTGSALVEWFDTFKRTQGTAFATQSSEPNTPQDVRLAPPKTLSAPNGKADDLTRIKGIGPKLSARLNDLGIYHFKQIANWSDTEALWVDDFLSFKGRVERERWISQARSLSANGAATVH